MERVDCALCSHFFVTWVTGTPYGCSAWGIKSRQHPNDAVYASSGIQCQLFKPRIRGEAGLRGRKQPKEIRRGSDHEQS